MNDDIVIDIPVVSPTQSDAIDSTASRLYNEYCKNGFVGPIDVVSISEATDILNAFWKDTNIFPDIAKNDTSTTGSNRTTTTTTTNIHPQSMTDERQHDPQSKRYHHFQYNQKNNNLFKSHLFVPYINHLIRNPQLIRAVQTVLQTNDIRCWSCDFNIRPSNASTMISPHQDATYAGLTPCDEVVTAWIALSDPVTIPEGGLVFYAGTHLLGQIPHTCDTIHHNDDNNHMEIITDDDRTTSHECDDTQTTWTGDSKPKLRNVLSRGQQCSIPHGCTVTSIPLRAGQATLHHSYTVHASGPNITMSSSQPPPSPPRVGLAVRYISAKVRKHHFLVKEMITHISGRTDVIHIDCFEDAWEPILPKQPTQQDVDRGKAVHTIAMERETINYFEQK